MMQRRLLNISAARAIAIERQVEDILTIAKAQSLQYRAARRRSIYHPSISGADPAPQTQRPAREADPRWLASESPELWSDFPESHDPFVAPTPESDFNLWMHLRSLFKSRSIRE